MDPFELDLGALSGAPARLRQFAAALPDALDASLHRWGQQTRAGLKSTPYPRRRRGQRTVRTGQLANRWRIERAGRGVIAIVNRAAGRSGFYAGYVIGPPEQQAYMHEGRWWQADQEVIDVHLARLFAQLDDDIDRAWTRQGL